IMIVRNEEKTLGACLASVGDLVNEIIVIDTRSTDGSREVAKGFGALVFDFPWCDDFAAARNESLFRARGDWILWLDADEFLDESNRAKLQWLISNLTDQRAGYLMGQYSKSHEGSALLVHQLRLFRNSPGIRWDYRVHEQLLPSLQQHN